MSRTLTPEQYKAARGETLLDYSRISNVDLLDLKRYLQEEITRALKAEETTTTTLKLHDQVIIKYNADHTLKCAFFRLSSHYFDDREAVSLNADGFIGLCGWADSKNSIPIYRAFDRWLPQIELRERARN